MRDQSKTSLKTTKIMEKTWTVTVLGLEYLWTFGISLACSGFDILFPFCMIYKLTYKVSKPRKKAIYTNSHCDPLLSIWGSSYNNGATAVQYRSVLCATPSMQCAPLTFFGANYRVSCFLLGFFQMEGYFKHFAKFYLYVTGFLFH